MSKAIEQVKIYYEDYKVLAHLQYMSNDKLSIADIIHKTLQKTVPEQVFDYVLGKENKEWNT